MTEEEAKQKWCPMNQYNNNCCASDCMLWRWVRDSYAEGYEPKPDHEDYNKGYCGLGGEP